MIYIDPTLRHKPGRSAWTCTYSMSGDRMCLVIKKINSILPLCLLLQPSWALSLFSVHPTFFSSSLTRLFCPPSLDRLDRSRTIQANHFLPTSSSWYVRTYPCSYHMTFNYLIKKSCDGYCLHTRRALSSVELRVDGRAAPHAKSRARQWRHTWSFYLSLWNTLKMSATDSRK